MSNVINLPTYEQVESVKTVITESGGTDWSKYTPFARANSVELSSPSSLESLIYSVQGEGFLSHAFLGCSSGSATTYLDVTVDGVLFATLLTSGTVSGSGIGDESCLKYKGSDLTVQVYNASKIITTRSSNKQAIGGNNFFITKPIFFKNSLEVKARIANATGSVGVMYDFSGGVAL